MVWLDADKRRADSRYKHEEPAIEPAICHLKTRRASRLQPAGPERKEPEMSNPNTNIAHMPQPDDAADNLRAATDAGDEGSVTEALEQALARQLGELYALGKVAWPQTQTAESIAKARAAQQAERQQLIDETLPEAARELARQNLQDSAAAYDLAQIICAAEAGRAGLSHVLWDSLPHAEKHGLVNDATVSLRLRRSVWRRLAIKHVQQALEDGLQTYAGRLPEPHRKCIASSLAGILFNAAVETLSGRVHVTASEFAAAWLPIQDGGQ